MKRVLLVFISGFIMQTTVIANTKDELKLINVIDNVYAIVGSTGNRSKLNLGNNATFGVVVTQQGVVLIDSGATYEGAASIHKLIKTVTVQPVKIVINSGGQDHRWLGNAYFKKQGAKIIANQRAVVDQKSRKQDQFFMLGNLLGKQGIDKTTPAYAEKTFDKEMNFSLGEVEFKLVHAGVAHTPGDSYIWLPKQNVMFTGDIVYVERMLGIFEFSSSKTWLQAFESMATLKPKFIVPGHGRPTSLAVAKKDTYDYLIYLRHSIKEYIEAGGGIENIGNLDQSKFSYLKNFDVLKGRNAQQVFQEIEFE